MSFSHELRGAHPRCVLRCQPPANCFCISRCALSADVQHNLVDRIDQHRDIFIYPSAGCPEHAAEEMFGQTAKSIRGCAIASVPWSYGHRAARERTASISDASSHPASPTVVLQNNVLRLWQRRMRLSKKF